MIIRVADLDGARRTIDIVDRCGKHPSALEIGTGRDGTSTVAVRFDGLPGQVEAVASALAEQLGGTACVVTDDESRGWWRAAVNRLGQPSEEVGELRLGVRPSAALTLATAVERSAKSHDISVESLTVWPALGTIIVRLDIDGGPGRSATALDALVGLAEANGATWRLTSVPVSLKKGRDVWGAAPASLQTMRRLKDQFDPGRVLNPGRFCGSI